MIGASRIRDPALLHRLDGMPLAMAFQAGLLLCQSLA
jgi:hypothetical protein